MSHLAEIIFDKLRGHFYGTFMDADAIKLIDLVLKERNKILRAEENYGPGFNRDGVVYRTAPDGTLTRQTNPNPR